MTELGFKRLDIDFYQGTYGETLRLSTEEIDDLRTLTAVFRSLSEDRAFDLASCSGAHTENVQQILLRKIVGKSQIKRLETVSQLASFDWMQDSEGWLESAELIEGMLDAKSPCHQYLTRDGQGKILVEVAFQED